jgi:hypothetical protein
MQEEAESVSIKASPPLAPAWRQGETLIPPLPPPSTPLSPPPAVARGRGRTKPGRCRRRRGLLVPSHARDGAGCLLHGVGMVRPPGTMARQLSSLRRREPQRSGAVAAWRTAWRLGGAEEAEKIVEKAGGGGTACPSWQPRRIS